MDFPLISIVLCSYNGAKFIEEQIHSLLQQTYPNLEIVISDDASIDGTPNLLEKYKANPAFKIFLQQRNLGPIKNVEFALKQTTGAFIAFCDQDDIWIPQKIDTLHAQIRDELLVYSDSELVDEQGVSLQKRLSNLRKMYSGNDTRGFVLSNVVWGHTILINRQLMPHILPIPNGIPHDIWMAFKAATIKGIKYIDVPLTKYRQHTDTVTKTIATNYKARTHEKLYRDFMEKLHWIDVMRQHAREDERSFYNQLFTLYAGKKKGSFQWGLASFLLQHRALLYRFSKKGMVSQMIDALKHARGVIA